MPVQATTTPASAQVGQPAPDFHMKTTADLKRLESSVSLKDYRGTWLVMFFYPADFTFVCPTEVTAFADRSKDFKELGAELLGVSTDSVYSHKAWIETPREKNGVGSLPYPLAADVTKDVARAYGVLVENEGVALRGLFIIDPNGILQYATVNSLNIGRSVDETLRILQALQTGGLCPANWRPGDKTLKVAA